MLPSAALTSAQNPLAAGARARQSGASDHADQAAKDGPSSRQSRAERSGQGGGTAHSSQPGQPSHLASITRQAPLGRLLRFGLTGGTAALIQLGLLEWLIARGTGGLAANAVAFIVAAQVNFWLSQSFTWRDRAS